MKNKEFFIGKLPPPIGGVTVFNQRKLECLNSNAQDVSFVLIEPKNTKFFQILLAFQSKFIVHISAANFLLILLACLFAKKDTIIFYDHNSSRHFINYPKWKKKIYEVFLNKCKIVFLVNPHLIDNYKVFDGFYALRKKMEIISAFLPPVITEKKDILNSYDNYLLEIYNSCLLAEKRRLVITSAFQPNLDANGKDIYSLNYLIDCFLELSSKFSEYYFLIAIANYPDTKFSQQVKNKVESFKNINSNLIFLENDKKIWPLLQVTKLFVRATTTDGDSVSLKEALHFGASVLASDVVPRPENVMLFNLENDNLSQKICEYLGADE